MNGRLAHFARDFAISFAAGLLIGVLYTLLHLATPAPPPSALIGLFGMVVGEGVGGGALRWIRHRGAGEP